MLVKKIIGIAAVLLPAYSLAGMCSFGSVQEVAFGQYAPSLSTETIRQQLITASCTQAAKLSISFGPSQVSGTINDRKMRNIGGGSSLLRYHLYKSTCKAPELGTGKDALSVLVSAGVVTPIYFCGVIPPLQQVDVGNYEDYVVLTISP
ncbi:Csu type fimbrial protein [Janthinobacterium sp. B9-8]|uniref:Csu type fimbrial protein n=1 Tax=Janthinobacterium sp. B9-8 TaxID=1236179 RepID=UPI00061CFAFA|nr:spore coat protein U domain-containing protein [Janthinobacterium sp. B9-8]AMC34457.1 hypothetical protein VN23_07505 [Janthinobacterium sp. B9-8]